MARSDDGYGDEFITTVPHEWFEELLVDLAQPPVVNPVLERTAVRRRNLVTTSTGASPSEST